MSREPSWHARGGVAVYWGLRYLPQPRPCPQVLLLGPAAPWSRQIYDLALLYLHRVPRLEADVYVPMPERWENGILAAPGWHEVAIRRSTHVLFWFAQKQTVDPRQAHQIQACLEDTRRSMVVLIPPTWLRSRGSPRPDHPHADRLFAEAVARRRAGFAPLLVATDLAQAITNLILLAQGRPPVEEDV